MNRIHFILTAALFINLMTSRSICFPKPKPFVKLSLFARSHNQSVLFFFLSCISANRSFLISLWEVFQLSLILVCCFSLLELDSPVKFLSSCLRSFDFFDDSFLYMVYDSENLILMYGKVYHVLDRKIYNFFFWIVRR